MEDMLGDDPTNVEMLDPELRGCVEEDETFGVLLRHPLVYQVPFFSWKLANEQLAYKRRRLAEAERAGDWETYIFLHERPYRLPALHGLWEAGRIDAAALRGLLPTFWIDSEHPAQHGTVAKALFAAAGFVTDRGGAGDLTDRAADPMRDRPARPLEVFRGCEPGDERGLSWTTDMAKAEWFAGRLGRGGRVYRCVVPPERVLGTFDGRGEREVVADVDGLEVVEA